MRTLLIWGLALSGKVEAIDIVSNCHALILSVSYLVSMCHMIMMNDEKTFNVNTDDCAGYYCILT